MTQEQYEAIIERLDKIVENQKNIDSNNELRKKELLKVIKSSNEEILNSIYDISTTSDEIKKRSSTNQ